LIKTIATILVHRFNQEFLITFGQLYFKRFSAIRSKRLTRLHYAHSHVTSQGPKRVLIPAGRERKQMTFFLKMGRGLSVNEKGHAPRRSVRTCLPILPHISPPFAARLWPQIRFRNSIHTSQS
jgi:hypothetical protein